MSSAGHRGGEAGTAVHGAIRDLCFTTRRAAVVRFGMVLIGLIASPTTCCRGEDRVWLEPIRPTASQSDWYARSIETRSGTILSLDSQQLRWVVAGDESESLVASHRVLWIEPGRSPDTERAALKLFAGGKFAESVRPLLDSVGERPPVWRQQWLSMLASYASWRGSRSAIALELVSQLDNRPLAPMAIAWLPIAWRSGAQSVDAIDAGRARLADSSPATRLVAASWLLSSADRAGATATLEQLAVNKERPLIARLAAALLWRVAAPPQVTESMGQWQQTIESLPMALQVGPTITLIEKLRAAGQVEAARRHQLSLKLTPPFPHSAITGLPELGD